MSPNQLTRIGLAIARWRRPTSRRYGFILGGLGLLLAFSPQSWGMSVDDYIGQVVSNNGDAIAASKQITAAEYQSSEGQLLTSPNMFFEVGKNNDGKQPSPPLLTYDRMEYESVKLGVAQNFGFGLQGKLYYEQSHTTFVNAPYPLTSATSDYYDTNPTLELSMPLWGNGFGRGIKAQKAMIDDNSLIDKYQAMAKLDAIKSEAQRKYWDLAIARESLDVEKKTLGYARDILAYVTKQARMRLGDKGDILQAKALVASKLLSLNNAENAVRDAQIAFNALRNINSEQVDARLEQIPLAKLTSTKDIPENPGQRMDLKIAERAVSLKQAQSQLTIEKNKPSLNVFAKYSLNSRNFATTDVTTDNPSSLYVGLNFSSPLDFSAAEKARESARLKQSAAKDAYQQTKVTDRRDWNTLKEQLNNAVQAYLLSDQLVDAQKLKLDNGKREMKLGKSTTFQILQFEQEYSQSEMSRLQIARQILALRSQLEFYHASLNGGEQ